MRHSVIALAGAIVTVLAGLLTVLQREDATRLATAVSAVTAVASLGVMVWAALPKPRERVRVARTGTARVGTGGIANTGAVGSAAVLRGAEVEDTGAAETGDGGEAITGIKEA